jgi:hypothetical protein
MVHVNYLASSCECCVGQTLVRKCSLGFCECLRPSFLGELDSARPAAFEAGALLKNDPPAVLLNLFAMQDFYYLCNVVCLWSIAMPSLYRFWNCGVRFRVILDPLFPPAVGFSCL